MNDYAYVRMLMEDGDYIITEDEFRIEHETTLDNSRAITSTFGLQVCRPHYVSQWPSAGLGFVDDKLTWKI